MGSITRSGFSSSSNLFTRAKIFSHLPGAAGRGTAAVSSRAGKLAYPWLMLALMLAGCSREHYRSQADKDTYGILGRKQQLIFGQTNAFTIDFLTLMDLEALPSGALG